MKGELRAAEAECEQLKQAVERMHECRARLVGTEAVDESFAGKPVWQGVIHVFELEGHPTADRAYAWSAPIEGSTKRRFFAVLHAAPVQSAADAVRAAIVAEHKRTGR